MQVVTRQNILVSSRKLFSIVDLAVLDFILSIIGDFGHFESDTL